MGARITHLSGALPFEFALGVELYDAQGLWLRLPACSVRWNWQALPGALHIAFVRVDNAELLRLPLLPQEATPPPAPPLTGLACAAWPMPCAALIRYPAGCHSCGLMNFP